MWWNSCTCSLPLICKISLLTISVMNDLLLLHVILLKNPHINGFCKNDIKCCTYLNFNFLTRIQVYSYSRLLFEFILKYCTELHLGISQARPKCYQKILNNAGPFDHCSPFIPYLKGIKHKCLQLQKKILMWFFYIFKSATKTQIQFWKQFPKCHMQLSIQL